MKKILSFIAVVSILIGMGMLVNCSENDNPSKLVLANLPFHYFKLGLL